jgi:DNA-binding NtrC family response regulator
VRVVCSTNRELHEEIEQGNFRPDLFYRIATMTIHLPPLRERAMDLPIICDYLLQYYNEKLNGRVVMMRPALMAKMQRYSWPGNIRQLENLVKRYVVMGTEDVILSGAERARYGGHVDAGWAGLAQEADTSDGPQAGSSYHPECSSRQQLEPQESRALAGHQLSRSPVQAERSWNSATAFQFHHQTRGRRGRVTQTR